MPVKVKFEKSEHAERVVEHLYNVLVVSDYLVFSEFDEEAFDLAVALEGLDDSAYDIIQNPCIRRTLPWYGSVVRQPSRLLDPPKYVVKVKLLESVPCLSLSANSAPRFLGYPDNSKDMLINITIDEVFAEFMGILLTQVSGGDFMTLSGRMDKVVFVAKNIGKKDVQHFLAVSCDSQPQTIQLHPVNNVSIERVSF